MTYFGVFLAYKTTPTDIFITNRKSINLVISGIKKDFRLIKLVFRAGTRGVISKQHIYNNITNRTRTG